MENNKTPQRVQEKIVRSIALQVIVISTLAIVFRQPIIMILLSIDFLIRAGFNSKYSLLSLISRGFLSKTLPFQDRMVLMRPKKFAAAIGAILSATAGILGLAGQIIPMIYLIAILLLFSFLETFFKFCAACFIFSLLIKFKIISEENCLDCKLDTKK